MNVEGIAVLALVLSALALPIAIWAATRLEIWRDIYKAAIPDSKQPYDPELVEHWQKRYDELPEHSVKWKAYRKKLIDQGILPDGD